MPRTLTYPRILCITLRAGSIGHAVLDGFGVAEGSFFTKRLDHLAAHRRLAAIARLVGDSCRRYAVTRIVLGLPEPLTALRRALAAKLLRRLTRRTRRAVVIRRLGDAAELLVDRARCGTGQALVERVASVVAPTLSTFAERTRRMPMYWRAAWHAVAVAFAELLSSFPFDAAALVQPVAFTLPAFRVALQEALTRV